MSNVYTCDFGGRPISLKTSYVAAQADGAVLVTYGDTVVLVTVVSSKVAKEGVDFLPLTVDYLEMTFAAGKIPGGFFKREGRPNEREILTSRLIDRSIRPLIPKGYNFETQLIATVLSADNENDPAVAAMLGASAALEISDIPFNGPVAGVRVVRVDGRFVCNPSLEEQDASSINLFLSGKKVSREGEGRSDVNLVMVEGEAKEAQEDDIVRAIEIGLESLRPILELQERMRQQEGKPKRTFQKIEIEDWVMDVVRGEALARIKEAYSFPRKLERRAALEEVRTSTVQKIAGDDHKLRMAVTAALDELERNVLRSMILKEKRRIDGRGPNDLRPLSAEVGLLPRAHGSALFSRGETQAMVTLTLGTSTDEQRIDFITGEEMRTFILHYNFPPYCVGETRPLRGPSRREIGHGNLARRALLPILPSQEEFPYTIRIVSEILSSNGSSSMATVCGGTLSLMDGGVPIKDMVAGIAMGLLKEGDEVVILSDILGDEDHAGDMDFKVCGTKKGITAMQMDIKIEGLTSEILKMSLDKARDGRMSIIDRLQQIISKPRPNISVYAPRITTIKVKPEKIRDVIGAGGKNIRQIINETGVTIDIEDDGTVKIASTDAEAAARAVAMVRWLTEEAEVGKIYKGVVKRVVDFGAFVEILPGTEGLVHISQLSKHRVSKVTDVLKEGDEIMVKVVDIDKQGKIRLSRKEALGADGKNK
ncbi:MAG: polyribonucleotide nucleotidyltransferase [Syntrophales bacterium]|nr:polyribonucleotide nucleotidyltransferase [Syntrophales bacterium]